MTIEEKEIKNIVNLARIAVSHEELLSLKEDLNRIVAMVETLKEVNVDGVLPMSYANHHQMQWRDDVPKPMIGREGVLGSAGYDDGLVRVPKIIE